MMRLLGWSLAGAFVGAGLCFLAAAAFVELLQPVLFPPKPGQGFNALGFVLYIFSAPSGAVVGGTVGLVWSLYRWKPPGDAPANQFGRLFSGLAVVCLLLMIARGENLNPLGWMLLVGLMADAVAGSAACFWIARRATASEPASTATELGSPSE